jgi:hypothetical protein
MNIAPGSILNMATATPGWTITFQHGEDKQITCPVIGWATVVHARDTEGAAFTSVEPVFVYLDTVWTHAELREHDHEVSSRVINAPAAALV